MTTQKLSADESWMIRPLAEGQNAMTAPTMVGDWVAVQTNGLSSDKKASSIVALHQDDASRVHTIFPFGELEPGEWSFAPPKPNADSEHGDCARIPGRLG